MGCRCAYNTLLHENKLAIHRWNLMVRGMYETVNAKKHPFFEGLPQGYGYVEALNTTLSSQDLRVFLAYMETVEGTLLQNLAD